MVVKNYITVLIGIAISFLILLPKAEKTEKILLDHKVVQTSLVPISNGISDFEPYSSIVEKMKMWEKQRPGIVEVNYYGESTKGEKIYYIRVGNKKGDVVLVTSCIHGNESLSAGITMAYIGNILTNWNDKEIQDVFSNKDVYFIPVISPDSYPDKRFVDNKDPNRNFPLEKINIKSVPPIMAFRNFCQTIKPKSVMSGHTYGKKYLFPYGDTILDCPHKNEYISLLKKMSSESGYAVQKSSNLYGHPINGTEMDWLYRCGSFAIVVEYGIHQRKYTKEEVKSEFDTTWKAFLIFVKESTNIIKK